MYSVSRKELENAKAKEIENEKYRCNPLQKYSTAQLNAELKRRKKEGR